LGVTQLGFGRENDLLCKLIEQEGILKKLMLVVAMLALVLIAAAPALALNPFKFGGSEINNSIGQQTESGDVTENFSVDQSGSNSSQCVTPQQFGNTGSSQNGQPVLQYNSVAGNLEPEGSAFTFAPVLSGGCEQTVQQSAAASG
jgi:hypothetical protein